MTLGGCLGNKFEGGHETSGRRTCMITLKGRKKRKGVGFVHFSGGHFSLYLKYSGIRIWGPWLPALLCAVTFPKPWSAFCTERVASSEEERGMGLEWAEVL